MTACEIGALASMWNAFVVQTTWFIIFLYYIKKCGGCKQ